MEDNKSGTFKRDIGDIWWVGIKHKTALKILRKQLATNLVESGFIIPKEFNPHITLARRVITNEHPYEIKPIIEERVTVVELIKSERIDGKLTYTSIYCKYAKE